MAQIFAVARACLRYCRWSSAGRLIDRHYCRTIGECEKSPPGYLPTGGDQNIQIGPVFAVRPSGGSAPGRTILPVVHASRSAIGCAPTTGGIVGRTMVMDDRRSLRSYDKQYRQRTSPPSASSASDLGSASYPPPGTIGPWTATMGTPVGDRRPRCRARP